MSVRGTERGSVQYCNYASHPLFCETVLVNKIITSRFVFLVVCKRERLVFCFVCNAVIMMYFVGYV